MENGDGNRCGWRMQQQWRKMTNQQEMTDGGGMDVKPM